MPLVKALFAAFGLAILAMGVRHAMLPDPVRHHVEVVSVLEIEGGQFDRYGRGAFAHRVRLPDGRRIRLWLSHAYRPVDLVKVGFKEYERSRSVLVQWDIKCARPCAFEEAETRTAPTLRPPR